MEQFIPTRLVSTMEGDIRVCLHTEVPASTEYATLSHCWGDVKFLTLLRANIAAFRAKIPQEALSQTFKDAISISQDLGFSYLWIDSLCILQDDPDDWRRESGLMGAVYGGSGLNIAASGAVDGSVGCFFSRPPTWRCQVELAIGSQASRYDCICSALPDTCLSNMPLVQRGWALQERLLPTRTLHFTTTEVFWECHQKSACESFPEELPPACTSWPTHFSKQPLTQSMWPWIVERYSTCKLTYARDKLVAISGLARHIQKQNKDQYVAGMWRTELESSLCWSSPKLSQHLEGNLYGAPTWSWASMDGEIRFSSHLKEKKQLHIRVLDIKIHLSGLDPFGPLPAAKLRLSCSYLLQVNIRSRGRNQYLDFNHESFQCTISNDYVKHYAEGLLQRKYALPVFEISFGQITGLLLAPSPQRGQYQRLGTFEIWGIDVPQAFGDALNTYIPRVADEDCYQVRKDKFGTTHHIIEII